MSTTVQWSGDTESKPAPEPLRRVQALINTVDLESGHDRFANAEDATPWLVANGLLGSGHTATVDELELLRGVREGLRDMVIHATHGEIDESAAQEPLRAIASATPVRAALEPDGTVTLAPVGNSLQARLLGLLLIVQSAQRDGTWTHLKACANEDCRWAFYDRSRNHGGTWCDMTTCGNKLKNREFRARRRTSR